jgi:hypothetical protein
MMFSFDVSMSTVKAFTGLTDSKEFKLCKKAKYSRLHLLQKINQSSVLNEMDTRPLDECPFSTDNTSSTRHELAWHDLVWFQAPRVSL